jgi:hypothetical protein
MVEGIVEDGLLVFSVKLGTGSLTASDRPPDCAVGVYRFGDKGWAWAW